jgi:protease I
MSLHNKKIVILLEEQYQDLEVWYPYYRLKEENAKVIIAAPKKDKEYKGKYGYPASADSALEEVEPKSCDAVIIPGGFAPDFMRRTPQVAQFVREMHRLGKVVAAICHGPWILASADIIRGKRVTCFYAIADDIKNAGGIYCDEAVVQDGAIITSRKPDDLPVFCKTIITALR